MNHILITGAGGNVGQYVAQELNRLGYSIIGTYRNKEPQSAKYKTIKIDLSKEELECNGIDVIIHIAARIEGTCEQLIEDNLLATQNLIRYAEKCHVKKFIYISTVSVYGDVDGILHENSDVHNPGIYSMTKLMCEKLLEESQIPSKMVIGLPRMLGPYVDLNNTGNSGFLKMVSKIIKNEEVHCYIPEVKYNNYMHVSDLVEFLDTCVNEEREYAKVLLATKDIFTMYHILEIMKKSINSTSELIKEKTENIPSCAVVSIEKAIYYGYRPISSKDTLEMFINEMRKKYEKNK